MNKAPFMCGLERFGDFLCKPECLCHGHRAAPQPPFERLSRNVFHDDARAALELGNFVDLADERMIEGCGRARFGHALLNRRTVVQPCRQKFQRDAPIEHQIISEPHLARAAFADHFDEAVAGRNDGGRVHVRQGSFAMPIDFSRRRADFKWRSSL